VSNIAGAGEEPRQDEGRHGGHCEAVMGSAAQVTADARTMLCPSQRVFINFASDGLGILRLTASQLNLCLQTRMFVKSPLLHVHVTHYYFRSLCVASGVVWRLL
jgi:hypothetical protein